MIDDNVAPTPQPGVDFSSLSPSPTPEQYFLLSRLDGKLTVGELCKISGLGRQKTLSALEALAVAGAIEVPGFQPTLEAGADSSVAETAQASPAANERAAKKKAARKKKRASKKRNSSAKTEGRKDDARAEPGKRRVEPNYPIAVDEFDFDEALLNQDIALDEQHRRELICLHAQLSQMTFYDMFGLEPDASKKDIKKAYFRMSKRYHPDKFFRKEMGDFGVMLETVFKEITKAYRTLSNKRKRQNYDRNLASQPSNGRSSHPGAAAQTSSEGQPVADTDPSEQNKRKAAAVLLMRRAEKLQGQGEHTAAAGEYRKALALNRDGDMAVRVACMLLDEAKMAKEALSFGRAALKLGADEVSARLVLARAHEALDARQAAIEQYEKVLLASPEHTKAKARLDELGHG